MFAHRRATYNTTRTAADLNRGDICRSLLICTFAFTTVMMIVMGRKR
jgi:hypothetical protein